MIDQLVQSKSFAVTRTSGLENMVDETMALLRRYSLHILIFEPQTAQQDILDYMNALGKYFGVSEPIERGPDISRQIIPIPKEHHFEALVYINAGKGEWDNDFGQLDIKGEVENSLHLVCVENLSGYMPSVLEHADSVQISLNLANGTAGYIYNILV